MPARTHEPDPIPTRTMLADLAGTPQALVKLQETSGQNTLFTALLEALATRVAPDARPKPCSSALACSRRLSSAS